MSVSIAQQIIMNYELCIFELIHIFAVFFTIAIR